MFKNKRKHLKYALALSMMASVLIAPCTFAAEKQSENAKQIVHETPKDGAPMPPQNFEPPKDKDGNPLQPPPCCKQLREGERPEPPKDKDGKPLPPPPVMEREGGEFELPVDENGNPLPPPWLNEDCGEDCPEPPKDENDKPLSPPHFSHPTDENGNPLTPPPHDISGKNEAPQCPCENEQK